MNRHGVRNRPIAIKNITAELADRISSFIENPPLRFQHPVPLIRPAEKLPDLGGACTAKRDSRRNINTDFQVRQFLDADYSDLVAKLNRMHDSQNKLILLLKEYPFGVLLASLMLTIIGAPLTSKLTAFIPGLHGQAAIAPLVLVLTLAAAYAISSSTRSRAASIFLGGLVVAVSFNLYAFSSRLAQRPLTSSLMALRLT